MNPMMKCGCAAATQRVMPDGSRIPSCITHNCIEVMDAPDLAGRTARCYCGNTQPSSLNLAFFEYRGPDSRESQTRCKCGYYWIAHQPRWRAEIEVDQKWCDCPRAKTINRREFHAPEGRQNEYADAEAKFWRDRIGVETPFTSKAPVFGVEVKSVTQITSPLKCKNFIQVGPQDDVYYCGCRGWD